MEKIIGKLTTVLLKRWKWFKSLGLKRKIIVIVLFIVGLFTISQAISSLTKPAPYTLEKVKRANITEVVTESGKITSSGSIDVFSPTNGIVTESFVSNGSYVKEGDKLFTVKSSASDQEAQAAHANYLAATVAFNSAQSSANTLRATMYSEWKTFRDLATNSTYEKGDDTPDIKNREAAEFQIAQDEWLAAEKKYKDQETSIAQAASSVASTRALYMATQDAIVTAPVDGIVTNLSVTKGTTISIKSVSLTGSATKPALLLKSDYKSEIKLEISETDIPKIKPGQKASIEVNAISNKIYNGVVDRVDAIGSDNEGVVTYSVYVALLNQDDKIRQGMTVDVDIKTKDLKNILSVSNSSVKPYKGGRAVRVPDAKAKEKFKYVPVVIGIRGSDRTQILEGIDEGQEVVSTLSNENVKRPGLFGS